MKLRHLLLLLSVLILFPPPLARAQNSASKPGRIMTGNVKNEKGEFIVGASVYVKSMPRIGTATDAKGEFRLQGIPAGKQIIVFTFIGMVPFEVEYANQRDFEVVLKEDATQVNEVVVTGIYSRDKNSFAGSAKTYTGKELRAIGTKNVFQSLKTLEPALTVVENRAFGADPNRLPDLEIRGKTSLVGDLTTEYDNTANQPLFILDGIEVEIAQIQNLSMDRIGSVTVLKDAASAAIYGSKASNGVIVVERKRIEGNKVRLSYNFVPKFSIPDLSSFNLTNAAQKLALEELAELYKTSDGSMDKAYDYKLQNVRRGVNTDWMKVAVACPGALCRWHGEGEPVELALSARGQNVDYRATASFSDDYGVMKGDNRRKYGLGFHIGYHLRDKLTIAFKTNFSLTDSENSPYGTFSDYVALNPYEPIRDENGEYIRNYYFNPYDTSSSKMANPLYDATLSSFSKARTQAMTNSLTARWNITKYFYVTGQGSISINSGSNDIYTSPDAAKYSDIKDISQKGEYEPQRKHLQRQARAQLRQAHRQGRFDVPRQRRFEHAVHPKHLGTGRRHRIPQGRAERHLLRHGLSQERTSQRYRPYRDRSRILHQRQLQLAEPLLRRCLLPQFGVLALRFRQQLRIRGTAQARTVCRAATDAFLGGGHRMEHPQ